MTSPMWIDTHCHLDAKEFAGQAADIAAAARQEAVDMIVIPSVERKNFAVVARLAHAHDNCCYALGIHPFFVPQAKEDDLVFLRQSVTRAMQDARFVAVGEIGLDFFVPQLLEPAMRDKQAHFYIEQLKIARDFDLPVLLHVRRAQDFILKHVRRIAVCGGIAHAFNGSRQQAHAFVDMGFKLGFGGAMTFMRAHRIRRLAALLPLDCIVLETDAPDMAPAWLHPGRNSPLALPRIGGTLAELRRLQPDEVSHATCINACAAMPRMRALL